MMTEHGSCHTAFAGKGCGIYLLHNLTKPIRLVRLQMPLDDMAYSLSSSIMVNQNPLAAN